MADESPFGDFDMPADDAPIEEPQAAVIEDDDDPFGAAAPADDQDAPSEWQRW